MKPSTTSMSPSRGYHYHYHHHHNHLPPERPKSAYLYLQQKSQQTKEFDYDEEAKRIHVDTEKDFLKRNHKRFIVHSSCSCCRSGEDDEPQIKRTRRRQRQLQDCIKKKANITRHQIILPFPLVASSNTAAHDDDILLNQNDQEEDVGKVIKQSTNSDGESSLDVFVSCIFHGKICIAS